MSNKFSRDSLRQRAKDLAGAQKETAAMLREHQGKLAGMEELVTALVNVVGQDVVEQAILDMRKATAEARIADEQAKLNAGLEAGYVLAAEEIGPESLVVALEKNKDGQVVGFGTQQALMAMLTDQGLKTLLLGKKKAEVVSLPNGNTIEIVGVYALDEEKMRAVVEAQAAAANQAASEVKAE